MANKQHHSSPIGRGFSSRVILFAVVALACAGQAWSARLEEARVTKILNQVRLIDPVAGNRKARLDDVVRGEIAVTTGIKSRSELLFQDDTLSRLGPESYFSFKTGTREMTLQRGTLLLQVPKKLGGARIHTAAVTAAITGTTVMVEFVPNKNLKFLVLEGTMRLSVDGRFGDSLLLTPGHMVIMSPDAKRIPDPVTVDLKKIVRTSTLINMPRGKKGRGGPTTLPSMALIEHEVALQQAGKGDHHLVDTNLVILGKGTNLLLASDNLMSQLATRTDIAKLAQVPVSASQPAPEPTPQPTPNPDPTPQPTPNPDPTPNPNPPPAGTPTPPPPTAYSIDGTTSITTQNTSATITTQGATSSSVVYKNVTTNGSPSAFLFGATSSFDNEFNFDNLYTQEIGKSGVFRACCPNGLC
jgi:FecR protein